MNEQANTKITDNSIWSSWVRLKGACISEIVRRTSAICNASIAKIVNFIVWKRMARFLKKSVFISSTNGHDWRTCKNSSEWSILLNLKWNKIPFACVNIEPNSEKNISIAGAHSEHWTFNIQSCLEFGIGWIDCEK